MISSFIAGLFVYFNLDQIRPLENFGIYIKLLLISLGMNLSQLLTSSASSLYERRKDFVPLACFLATLNAFLSLMLVASPLETSRILTLILVNEACLTLTFGLMLAGRQRKFVYLCSGTAFILLGLLLSLSLPAANESSFAWTRMILISIFTVSAQLKRQPSVWPMQTIQRKPTILPNLVVLINLSLLVITFLNPLIPPALSLTWFITIVNIGINIRRFQRLMLAYDFVTRLISPAAKRFIQRKFYGKSRRDWALTSGVQTVGFVINHDPEEELDQQLPQSILHIRNAEINRCVHKLIRNRYINIDSTGNQIWGTIDPETSHLQCIDVLSAFAAVHLDAAVLVEKRIHGLSSILPILDPKLAKAVSPENLPRIFSRNLWLYHFDYVWVDQFAMHSSTSSEYKIYAQDLLSKTHSEVYRELKKKNQLGNFIWIGDAARQRLSQEAPSLNAIINAWPIKTSGGKEELVFLIKFEDLIPRLQSYYNLDNLRKVLVDFEAREEALRSLNIFELQIKNCKNFKMLNIIIRQVSEYPWIGFREKDYALQIIKKGFEKALTFIDRDHQDVVKKYAAYQKHRDHFIHHVVKIGYPSKLLHLAHLDKIRVRNLDSLLANSLDPSNTYYFDSWNHLANTNVGSYDAKETKQLFNFILLASCHSSLKSDLFALSRALQLCFSFCEQSQYLDRVKTAKIFDALANWLVSAKAPPPIIAQYIDTKNHFDKKSQIDLPPDTVKKLASYVAQFESDHRLAHRETITDVAA